MNHEALISDPFYPSFHYVVGLAHAVWSMHRDDVNYTNAVKQIHVAISYLTVGKDDEVVTLLQRAAVAAMLPGQEEIRDVTIEAISDVLPRPQRLPLEELSHQEIWVHQFMEALGHSDDADDADAEMDRLEAEVLYSTLWHMPPGEVISRTTPDTSTLDLFEA